MRHGSAGRHWSSSDPRDQRLILIRRRPESANCPLCPPGPGVPGRHEPPSVRRYGSTKASTISGGAISSARTTTAPTTAMATTSWLTQVAALNLY
jgi:hypothetical protein